MPLWSEATRGRLEHRPLNSGGFQPLGVTEADGFQEAFCEPTGPCVTLRTSLLLSGAVSSSIKWV